MLSFSDFGSNGFTPGLADIPASDGPAPNHDPWYKVLLGTGVDIFKSIQEEKLARLALNTKQPATVIRDARGNVQIDTIGGQLPFLQGASAATGLSGGTLLLLGGAVLLLLLFEAMNWPLIALGAVGVGVVYAATKDTPPVSPKFTLEFSPLNGKADIAKWADAIARFEGVNPNDGKVTTPERLNNPGDLRDPKTGAYRVFATPEAGMDALKADLAAKVRKYPDWTLAQIMQRYAPASDGNDPLAYARFVASQLGVSITDTLKGIFHG
jgi:hypothetical protein